MGYKKGMYSHDNIYNKIKQIYFKNNKIIKVLESLGKILMEVKVIIEIYIKHP